MISILLVLLVILALLVPTLSLKTKEPYRHPDKMSPIRNLNHRGRNHAQNKRLHPH